MKTMTKIFAVSALLASSVSVSALPAYAKSRGFDTTISEKLSTPVKLEVVLSDDLAHRANNLPDDISKRSGSNRLNAGFANNGYYGDKALQYLVDEVVEEFSEDFEKRNLVISDTASTTLRVTIVDVKNNRPTFEQLSREPNLSLESFGIGGIELEAELIGADAVSRGEMTYVWYENDIRDGFARTAGIWSDARRGISRFSKRAAKSLS